jgi:SHS2 domain-containing protein
MVPQRSYEYIDHTADLGIRVYGKTIKDLFNNIAKAIFETQIEGEIELIKEMNIELTSESQEDLFIDWCRELLYNFSVHGFIPKTYELSMKNTTLTARLVGDTFDAQRHTVQLEIKNVTYHDFRIEKKGEYYHASVIFDV